MYLFCDVNEYLFFIKNKYEFLCNIKKVSSFLGGLSLHLNHLIA